MGSDNDCVSICGRITLVILNIIFLIIGFVLLVLGILVFAYTPALDFLFTFASGAFTSSLSGASGVQFDTALLVELVQTGAYVLIGLGAFFFLISLLGIIGGCCRVNCVLIVYAVLMIILVVAQIALMIIVFSQRQVLDDAIKTPLQEWTAGYTRFNGTDATTVTMNILMIQFQCCGVANYQDFKTPRDGGKWINTYGGQTLDTPALCCVKTDGSELPGCAQTPGKDDPNMSNANKGCYSEIWTAIDAEQGLIIGVCSAIIVFQAILVFFAIYIVYKASKEGEIV